MPRSHWCAGLHHARCSKTDSARLRASQPRRCACPFFVHTTMAVHVAAWQECFARSRAAAAAAAQLRLRLWARAVRLRGCSTGRAEREREPAHRSCFTPPPHGAVRLQKWVPRTLTWTTAQPERGSQGRAQQSLRELALADFRPWCAGKRRGRRRRGESPRHHVHWGPDTKHEPCLCSVAPDGLQCPTHTCSGHHLW